MGSELCILCAMAEAPVAQPTPGPTIVTAQVNTRRSKEVPGPQDALDGPLPARKFYRLNLSQYGEDVERVAQAMLWAGACSAVGWVLGFLFGIPRTLSGQPDQPARQATAGV